MEKTNKTKQLQQWKELSMTSSILTGLAGGNQRESISGDTSRVSARVTSAQAWFTSSQLQSHLTSAVSELQSALDRMSEAWDGDSGRDDRGQLVYDLVSEIKREVASNFREGSYVNVLSNLFSSLITSFSFSLFLSR